MRENLINNVIQGNLFCESDFVKEQKNSDLNLEILSLPDAEISFYPHYFKGTESDLIFEKLCDEIKWRQDKIKLYGKEIELPRKTAWYGELDKTYKFSGIQLLPEPWTPILLKIKTEIEKVAEVKFNSVMMNLYRDGNDGISWHTDAEPELGKNPVIGSVSFGETRRFMLRHKYDKTLKSEIELTSGSFLLMGGSTQHFWQHQIPKTSKKLKTRINLTFRVIISK